MRPLGVSKFYIRYYGWGDFKHRQNTCKDSGVMHTFNFIIARIPYRWLFFRLPSHLYEEKDEILWLQQFEILYNYYRRLSMRTTYKRAKYTHLESNDIHLLSYCKEL
ncbi:hypothetical protein IFM89_026871 [Coptis chinensis]|uniref:Uncharacterized protein n=1 Tax=Coptis chinensis TaxID=261450 RepID=A0A835IGA8_9MAGN|nr:hypothetical protein IFM89_026871 [Coptis chinensis]